MADSSSADPSDLTTLIAGPQDWLPEITSTSLIAGPQDWRPKLTKPIDPETPASVPTPPEPRTLLRTWPVIVEKNGYSRRTILRHARHLIRSAKVGHATVVEVCLEDLMSVVKQSRPVSPIRLGETGQPA